MQKEDPNQQNYVWKMRHYNWHHRNTKDYKRLLWTTICEQIQHLDEVEKFLETYNPPRLIRKI